MARMLKAALEGLLTSKQIQEIYAGFDIVGDIAIMKVPDSILSKKQEIANALLSKVKSVRTVLRQITPITGDYRTRSLEVIGGEERFETFHKEHGCIYHIDLRKVYFSPRLSTERFRVARVVKPKECIINMFAGVGCFSILIAKRVPDVVVYSIDINPDAYRFMVENTKINKVADRVKPILSDAREVISKRLSGIADRILMPLPEKAFDYIFDSMTALKPKGGVVHFYCHIFTNKGEIPVKKALAHIREVVHRPFTLSYSGIVREVGPRWNQLVFDMNFT